MKREFLKELGVEEAAIEKIMTENGKDIEAVKAKTKADEQSLAQQKSEKPAQSILTDLNHIRRFIKHKTLLRCQDKDRLIDRR